MPVPFLGEVSRNVHRDTRAHRPSVQLCSGPTAPVRGEALFNPGMLADVQEGLEPEITDGNKPCSASARTTPA